MGVHDRFPILAEFIPSLGGDRGGQFKKRSVKFAQKSSPPPVPFGQAKPLPSRGDSSCKN